MEIVRLPYGERAPVDTDCISIEELPDGRFAVSGSVLSPEGESEAIVSRIVCDRRDEAEGQGIAWAQGCEVERLFLSTWPPDPRPT